MISSISMIDLLYINKHLPHLHKQVLLSKFNQLSQSEKDKLSSKKLSSKKVRQLVDDVKTFDIIALKEMSTTDLIKLLDN